jgi:hypothetical protein
MELVMDKSMLNKYGISMNTERYELFAKMGYVFPQQKFKSIVLQMNVVDHTQNSYFGLTNYNDKQKSFYDQC